MPRLEACQFVLQLLMIRLPNLLQIAGAFCVRRRFARQEAWAAVEQHVGIQAGSGGGIQRLVVRRAVQIDDEARIVADQHAGAHRPGKVVQLRNVPVGIGQRAGVIGQPGLDRRRQLRAGVRDADQQRQAAALEAKRIANGH